MGKVKAYLFQWTKLWEELFVETVKFVKNATKPKGATSSAKEEFAIFGSSSSNFTYSAGFISLAWEASLVSTSEAVLLLGA